MSSSVNRRVGIWISRKRPLLELTPVWSYLVLVLPGLAFAFVGRWFDLALLQLAGLVIMLIAVRLLFTRHRHVSTSAERHWLNSAARTTEGVMTWCVKLELRLDGVTLGHDVGWISVQQGALVYEGFTTAFVVPAQMIEADGDDWVLKLSIEETGQQLLLTQYTSDPLACPFPALVRALHEAPAYDGPVTFPPLKPRVPPPLSRSR